MTITKFDTPTTPHKSTINTKHTQIDTEAAYIVFSSAGIRTRSLVTLWRSKPAEATSSE
jgi:hypothetical protein